MVVWLDYKKPYQITFKYDRIKRQKKKDQD